MPKEPLYDCLIVGGGPAGLSAAIYMGRFLRKVLVLDEGRGRSSFAQVNENYLGFPDGIKVRELRDLGQKQAERFGVKCIPCQVEKFEEPEPGKPFRAVTSEGSFAGKTVILCCGVRDIWPNLPGVEDYVGKSLFWCITCDGFRALDKRVVCFGANDEAATTACQFLLYTRDVTFVHEPDKLVCSEEQLTKMKSHAVKLVCGTPSGVDGSPDRIESVVLQDGKRIPADIMFSLLGCLPNNKLALDLGVECDVEGYVKVDQEGYTSVPGVFCAGDLSRMHTHQVVAAAHEGAEAAQTCNYWLYASFQREAPERPDKKELKERVRSSSKRRSPRVPSETSPQRQS